MIPAAADTGFSLVEALVAMAVLAVASAGLLRATEAHIDLIAGLQTRAVAGWVAENRLVELRLPGGGGVLPAMVDMLGRRWQVANTVQPSDDPDLEAVGVAVSVPGAARPVVTLRGFRDRGAPPIMPPR